MRILRFLLLVNLLFALEPTHSYKASGGVTDMVYDKGKLYVATDASRIDIFDTTTQTKLQSNISVPQIKDFMGDTIESKIYSVDKSNDKILLVSQGAKGFREIYLYEKSIQKIIGIDKKMFISKAMFVDETKILFALLSNELFLYDVKTQKNIWKIAVSHSKFSDFTLNEAKDRATVADESGNLKIVDISSGMIINTLKGQNLDNVFKVDTQNNKIITAGQDRRCVVYDLQKPNKTYYLQSSFLIYAAALSPSANLGAYSSDEENSVVVFDTQNKKSLYKLEGNKMTLSKILFINENEVFVSSDSNILNYYRLSRK
ncbi:MAG: WD40 repeat domain-containing protein [Campylobacterales bacterium]|nr:WD40 repeat domain-containing protein [Campylobacterales bacterium]